MPYIMFGVKEVKKHRREPLIDHNDYFGLIRKDRLPKNWNNLKLGQKQVYQMIGLHDSIVKVKIPKSFRNSSNSKRNINRNRRY